MLPLLFLAGLGAGILVNSLADNLPPDENDIRHPPRRPRCRACGQDHRPRYWLALASFLFNRGRCEHCQAPRPWRALSVELVTAISLPYLWLWAGQQGEDPQQVLGRFLAAAVVVVSFILITVIDVEHRLILWGVVLPVGLAIALIGSLAPDRGAVKTLVGGLAGYGITLAIFLFAELYARLVKWVRGQSLDEVAFGGGDVNLAAVVGFTVGWPGVILALIIAILAGGLFSLVYIVMQLARRRYVPHSVMPYGPFLVLGALVIYLYGTDLAALWLAGR
jgi:prepilin signal peptidase PulO-like enzyme (type II secretory pathway)